MTQEQHEKAMVRILVAGDHLVVREGLRLLLAGEQDFVLVGDARDGAEAVSQVKELEPDVVLMDLRMPGLDGLEAIERIHQRWPWIGVVILTTYDDDGLMLRALRAGACSYLLKDVDRATLFHAIRTAARGETLLSPSVLAKLLERGTSVASRHGRQARQDETCTLTKRERTILEGVARGERNKEIAVRLGISEPTVKTHLASIYAKLAVDSRAAAVAVALERGVLSFAKRNTG